MAAKYPLSMCVDELAFVADIPKAIVAAEYTIINLNEPSWDNFVYQKVLTEGHPVRHEVPASNALVGGSDYKWRARFQDEDGNWSCPSEGPAGGFLTFTQADLPDRGCLDCARVSTGTDGRFGVTETDSSSIYIYVRSFSGGATTLWVYRSSVDIDGSVTRVRISFPTLVHSAGSDGTYAHEYLVKNHQLYILYATNIGSVGSEAIFCRIDLNDPAVVVDSMSVIWWDRGITIQDEIRLVYTDNGFVAFIVVDEGTGNQLEAYQLDTGTWSGASYPTGALIWAPAVFDTLYNYSLISFRPKPGTYIVFGVQNEATGVAVYRFDIQNATFDKVYQANPLPPANGSAPVFVNFLPGETIIRVLAAHYTPGTGAEVLSLSFDATDLSLVHQQVIPYISQEPYITVAAGADPQPYASTLTSLGNSRVLMTRSVITLNTESYAEIEVFQYVANAGPLIPDTVCARTMTWYDPADASTGTYPELSLAAHLDVKFHSSSKVLIPIIRSPISGTRHTWGDFVRGAFLDYGSSLELLDKREYGEEIATASGFALESVGLRGNVGNDTLQLTVPADTTLGGLKVSAVFDRADPSVWASSAWVLIRELNYAFPLVLGDETGIWPIVMTDEGVSVGSNHGTSLGAGTNLTFEVFQINDFLPAAVDITYASLSITAYTKKDSEIVDCPIGPFVIDDYAQPYTFIVDPDQESAYEDLPVDAIFDQRRVVNYFGAGQAVVTINGTGNVVFSQPTTSTNGILQYLSTTDVNFKTINTIGVTVTALSGTSAALNFYFIDANSSQLFVSTSIDAGTPLPHTYILDMQHVQTSFVVDFTRIRGFAIAPGITAVSYPASITLSVVTAYQQIES